MHRGEVQEVTSKKRSYHGHEHDYFWFGQVLETLLSWEPQPSANVCYQIVLNMADCQVENLNTLQTLLNLNKIGHVKFANIVSNYDIRIHFTYEILQIISK